MCCARPMNTSTWILLLLLSKTENVFIDRWSLKINYFSNYVKLRTPYVSVDLRERQQNERQIVSSEAMRCVVWSTTHAHLYAMTIRWLPPICLSLFHPIILLVDVLCIKYVNSSLLFSLVLSFSISTSLFFSPFPALLSVRLSYFSGAILRKKLISQSNRFYVVRHFASNCCKYWIENIVKMKE